MIPRSLPLSAALLLPLAGLAGCGSALATDLPADAVARRAPSYPELGGPAYDGPDIAVTDEAIYGLRSGGGGVQHGAGASPAKNPDEAKELGAKWLASIENRDGGWGAGAWGDANAQQQSDVATTAMVVMALMETGGHEEAVKSGTMFIVDAIEESDPHSPRLRTPEGTQPQYKLGQLVDTHLAALALSEVNGQFDDKTNAQVAHALDYVVGKVQMAQQADGSFDSNGWAPVLSSSIAAMSLYNAAEQGVEVREEVFERAERYQTGNIDSESGRADASAGAGVELYAAAGGLRNAQKAAGRGGAMSAPAQEAQTAMSDRVSRDADALMSGFGSVGGEEMLSYMMISDALAEEGGKTWSQWDDKVGDYLLSIQNADGSWVGHHCITSPVFVTAGAVLTLTAGDAVPAQRKQQPQKAEAPRKGGAPLIAVDATP
ncbi:MAG: hypothetical protein H6741_14010 [Alphaproteobacteria bacterium]|nr:hypothetical protein [Alphaproteobacteria bacterium]MCB9793829.1 hypothetical protein [Alphaproteobacteria bacterium]